MIIDRYFMNHLRVQLDYHGPQGGCLLGLDSLGVYLAKTHMDISPSRHHLIFGRSIFRHTGRGRDEGNVMIAAEKEWD